MSKYTYTGFHLWKFDFLNQKPDSGDFDNLEKFATVQPHVCLQSRMITMAEWLKWICFGEDNIFKLKHVAIHE